MGETPMREVFQKLHLVILAILFIFSVETLAPALSDSNDIDYIFEYSEPVNLSNTPASISQSPAFSLDPYGNISVVWQETKTQELMYSNSLDDGKTFSEPIALFSYPDFSVGQMSMATFKNRTIHIAFTIFGHIYGGAEIGYLKSTDGTNFSDILLVSEIDNYNSITPSIAVDASKIVIVWGDTDLDTGVSQNLLSRSIDDGLEFSAPQILSEHPSSCPDVEIWNSQNIYVVWIQGFHPNEEILFVKSKDAGLTFSSPINISNIPEKSWCPKIKIDKTGTIYVVWEEGSYLDIKTLITRSIDGGDSFSSPKVLSVNIEYAECSALTVGTDGRVYITYSTGSFTDHAAKNYLRVSSDKGLSFSNPSMIPVLSDSGLCPEIIGTEDRLHLLWSDGWQDTFPDLFYSHGAVSGPPGPKPISVKGLPWLMLLLD